MPRRHRKRSADGKRSALVFAESPVNGTHKAPTPIFCSDNPATADVVPLNENTTVAWVSTCVCECNTGTQSDIVHGRLFKLANVSLPSFDYVLPSYNVPSQLRYTV